MPTAPSRLVVHLIHGTWGRGLGPVVREELGRPAAAHPVYWFEKDSAFRKALTDLLPDIPFEFRQFVWSGSNSFAARSTAAAALREYLTSALQEPQEAKASPPHHVLIGHSHAGNVIFETLTGPHPIAEDGRIAGVLTLATPYLAMETDTGGFSVTLHNLLPTILGGFVLGLIAFCALLGHGYAAGWLAGSVVAYAAGLARLQPRSPWRWPRELLFWAAALGAAACVGLAVLPWFAASSYPAHSFYALFGKGFAPAAALALALTSLALLVAARAAGATPPGTFLLRDLVQALAVPYACVVLIAGSVWIALFDPSPYAGWYGVWLVACLPLSLVVANARGHEPRASALDVFRAEASEHERPVLPCELHAMRMAGDEASLAIVASQLVRAVASSPRKIYAWLSSWSPAAAIGVGIAMLLVGAVVGYLQAGELASGWLQVVVGVVIGMGEIVMLLLAAVLLSMAALVLLATLSYGLVGLAVGTDVLALMPAVRVGCESLPRGNADQMKLTLLWPDPEERKALPLRHSMYDLPSVQARVARWLRQAYRRV